MSLAHFRPSFPLLSFRHSSSSSSSSFSSIFLFLRAKKPTLKRTSPSPFLSRVFHDPTAKEERQEEEQEQFSVLTSVTTEHNDIVIVDTPKSRFLLLDSTRNYFSPPLSFSKIQMHLFSLLSLLFPPLFWGFLLQHEVVSCYFIFMPCDFFENSVIFR